MGDKKNNKGKLLLLIGAFCVVLALVADNIGIGTSRAFGWKQTSLLIVGLIIAFIGSKPCKCCKESNADKEEEEPPQSTEV